jgi:hypothetical protein
MFLLQQDVWRYYTGCYFVSSHFSVWEPCSLDPLATVLYSWKMLLKYQYQCINNIQRKDRQQCAYFMNCFQNYIQLSKKYFDMVMNLQNCLSCRYCWAKYSSLLKVTTGPYYKPKPINMLCLYKLHILILLNQLVLYIISLNLHTKSQKLC